MTTLYWLLLAGFVVGLVCVYVEEAIYGTRREAVLSTAGVATAFVGLSIVGGAIWALILS